MAYIFYFFTWTFVLYWIHRIGHRTPIIKDFHRHHHVYVNKNITTWHWNNLFLFNDDWPSTIDLWITEVIPTLLFSLITNQWWISIFYYIWAAFLQEPLEHRRGLNLPLLTCGSWHLKHHNRPDKNFGLFFPVWDRIFGTELK
jgi:sterol desaturase/sphingolipid hydroxylase (fatty acid hydroxylase superfamily)